MIRWQLTAKDLPESRALHFSASFVLRVWHLVYIRANLGYIMLYALQSHIVAAMFHVDWHDHLLKHHSIGEKC